MFNRTPENLVIKTKILRTQGGKLHTLHSFVHFFDHKTLDNYSLETNGSDVMNSSRRTENPVEVGALDIENIDNDLEELILDPGQESQSGRNKNKSTQNTPKGNNMFSVMRQPYRDPLKQPLQYVYSNVSRINIKPDNAATGTKQENGALQLNLNGDSKNGTARTEKSNSSRTTSSITTPKTPENGHLSNNVKTDSVRMRTPSELKPPGASHRQRNEVFQMANSASTNRTARSKVDKNQKGFSHEERDMYIADMEEF